MHGFCCLRVRGRSRHAFDSRGKSSERPMKRSSLHKRTRLSWRTSEPTRSSILRSAYISVEWSSPKMVFPMATGRASILGPRLRQKT